MCPDPSDAEHNSGVTSLACYFADIRNTQEALGLIRAATPPKAGAAAAAESATV